MEMITSVLIMLVAVVASGFMGRALPAGVPLPLIQIALGALVAYATPFRVELHPEIFFVLFLPPLLFLDGWRIPKTGLFRDGVAILELALGLVIFTVVGVGLFIHWLIPGLPIAVAFALAAVLSPTDPIAVSAIAARHPIPKRLMHILEGESLLNDASGLVCLRFAVAAAMTGAFSLVEASVTFAQLAIGGVAIGACLTWAITWAKGKLSRMVGEESGSQILISLLIPFAAYMTAEHFHCSGILAAVSAGVMMSYAELGGGAQATTRVRRAAVWDMVQFALNGLIFVLLGEQLPGILANAPEAVKISGRDEVWWLLVLVVAIAAALGVMRFVWVWASMRLTLYRRRKDGLAPKPDFWLVATISFAGVRGAITLAGVLTLPLVMADGSPFPGRDLAILLAAAVIIASLIGASVFLPIVLKRMKAPPEESEEAGEELARKMAAEAAIQTIEKRLHEMAEDQADADIYTTVAVRLMDYYRNRIDGRTQTGEDPELLKRADAIERQLRLAALAAERAEVYRIGRARKAPDDIVRKLVREIDLIETRFST
jgi:Na+/H+ antiporter